MEFLQSLGEHQVLILAGGILSLLLGVILGWSSGFTVKNRRMGELEATLLSETNQATFLREQNEIMAAELDLNRSEIERLSSENAGQAERVISLEEKLRTQSAIKEDLGQVLDLVRESKNTDDATVLQMLTPVAEQVTDLQQRIESFVEVGSRDRTFIQEIVQNMGEFTSRVDASKEELLKALKNEHRVYTNWGKTVLTRVMELAGLHEGREYQTLSKKEIEQNPDVSPPDLIIRLPGNRELLIDSEVSLEHWNKYVDAAQEDSERERALADFSAHVKERIDLLSSQDYSCFSSIHEVDFTFLFVPVESAWIHLMQEDPGIAAYAQEHRIAVVSASNLLLALKLVGTLWRSEERYANIDKIFERAHLLYKKWQAFTHDLARIGTAMDRMQNEYKSAMQKLTHGRGNLVRQTEELLHLGAERPAGKLPESIAEGLLADELEGDEATETEVTTEAEVTGDEVENYAEQETQTRKRASGKS